MQMNRSVTIDLIPDGDVEAFNEQERNLAHVCVSIDGEATDSSRTIVTMSLSREGMIGLATELLRAAHRPAWSSTITELCPSRQGFICERYGIVLHPLSCRLNLIEHDMGTISEAIEEAQQDVHGNTH
jgi:hypothetical protein